MGGRGAVGQPSHANTNAERRDRNKTHTKEPREKKNEKH